MLFHKVVSHTHFFILVFILGKATEVLRIFKSQPIRDLADAFIAKAKIILDCLPLQHLLLYRAFPQFGYCTRDKLS